MGQPKLNYTIIRTKKDFNRFIKDFKGSQAVDIETTCLYPWQKWDAKGNAHPAKVVSIGFGTDKRQWCLPVEHPESPWDKKEIKAFFKHINRLMDDVRVITSNGKFDMLWLRVHYGVKWPIFYDTMLASYMMDENSLNGLKDNAMRELNAPDWEIGLDKKQGHAPLEEHCEYLAWDIYWTFRLKKFFSKIMKSEPDVERFFKKVMMPCANLYTEIQYDGVVIDESQYDEAETVIRSMFNKAAKDLEKWEPTYEIRNPKGKLMKFNWGSPKMLGKLLFEDFGLEVLEVSPKTGAPSCNKKVLARLDHPCLSDLLKYKGSKHQLSCFIDGWKPYFHKRGDLTLLHPNFKLHGTVTGRPSCVDPNLQQVPRDPRIRSLITAEPGWTMVEWDLGQAELRVAAELSREPNMMRAFREGIDIHWLTAIKEISRKGGSKELVMSTANRFSNEELTYAQAIELLLKIGPDAAAEFNGDWKKLRKKAKAINFGYLYGMWWRKFKQYARDSYGVVLTDGEAKESRIGFFDDYPGLPQWHARQKRYVKRHGFVRTLSGRKRRLPAALMSWDSYDRQKAERQAINSPVQAFASDINLMAVLQLGEEYSRNVVKICGTVHDAILARVRNDYVKEVYHRMLEVMTWPDLMNELEIEMVVPIAADGSIGPWGKGIEIEKYDEVSARLDIPFEQVLNTMTSSEVYDSWKENKNGTI